MSPVSLHAGCDVRIDHRSMPLGGQLAACFWPDSLPVTRTKHGVGGTHESGRDQARVATATDFRAPRTSICQLMKSPDFRANVRRCSSPLREPAELLPATGIGTCVVRNGHGACPVFKSSPVAAGGRPPVTGTRPVRWPASNRLRPPAIGDGAAVAVGSSVQPSIRFVDRRRACVPRMHPPRHLSLAVLVRCNERIGSKVPRPANERHGRERCETRWIAPATSGKADPTGRTQDIDDLSDKIGSSFPKK